jgi:hypothetical protein
MTPDTQHDLEAGRARGREWAEGEADPEDLAEVAKLQLQPGDYSLTIPSLKRSLDPDSVSSLAEFKDYLFGEQEASGEYIAGFVEGAREFFYEQNKGR